jgi:magnesium chelatase family protein
MGRRPLPSVPPLPLSSERGEDGTHKLSEDRRAAARSWEAIQGQSNAKEAAVIAATGLHNVLLMGSPGVGKSMIANSLNGLMPELAPIQAREVQSIHALSNVLSHSSTMAIDHDLTHRHDLSCLPPFRAPHHTASAVALVGGGHPVIPGEVSLAHRGVLFLDELAEFGRASLEALREPLETGEVHIVRMRTRLSLPARVLLVAAMNPCPCGYYGASLGPKQCHCSSEQVQRYRMRLSGPLLDRFDLALLMKREPPLQPMQNTDPSPAPESHAKTRQRIERARQKASDRQGCANGLLQPEQLHELAKAMSAPARGLLRKFMDVSGNSLRVHDRLLRVAFTVADLDDAPRVEPAHMAKAIEMRRGLDRPDAIKALD